MSILPLTPPLLTAASQAGNVMSAANFGIIATSGIPAMIYEVNTPFHCIDKVFPDHPILSLALYTYTYIYICQAYPASYKGIIEELFTAAFNLVQEHDILPSKISRSDLQTCRKQHSPTLISNFRDRLEIKGHPMFIEHLCLGVLTYIANLVKTKGSASPATKAETSIKEEDERPKIVKQDSTRNLLIQPPETWPSWKLEDFELICWPYRNSVNCVGQELKASAIEDWRKDADLKLKDIRFSKLQELLENAGLINNMSQAELTYHAEGDMMMGIKNDDDLQLAMPTSLKFSAGLPTTGPLMPLGPFLPGRPSTHHHTFSIRSKNNRPASKPGQTTRKRPTPSVDSSSDSDKLLQHSQKKLKGTIPLEEEKEDSEEEGPTF
uniref:Uncharacterized protein n=1 Tax=Cladonia uncialis subsp. uncialis TaxID=180999 RepID=A0A2K9YDU4_CLAUC|nr:hypothetical protein [Cladonia uncialis subsp. uncialis]